MFYAGGYNNEPQQIGAAESDDGIHFRRISQRPLVSNGSPGSWNASESGHPFLFADDDGRHYLFDQGNRDQGRNLVPVGDTDRVERRSAGAGRKRTIERAHCSITRFSVQWLPEPCVFSDPSYPTPENRLMSTSLHRRQWLTATGAAAAGLVFHIQRSAHAAPQAEILETKVISQQPDLYHGWPTLARCRNGQLLVVCSGGREAHVCPFGRVELMRSHDQGQTWTWPEIVLDGPIDDRDAGVLETAKGSILITTFTSLAYEPILAKAEKDDNWAADRLARWQAAHTRVGAEQRQASLGVWMKPIDRWRSHVLRPVRHPGQQPARTNPPRTGASCMPASSCGA